jgi:uncharacterized phage infection (PIP) family protein YhgE
MSLDLMAGNKKRGSALVSLKDEAKALANESRAVREEAGRLEESNKQLQARFNSIQSDASKLAREKASLQSEVNTLRRQVEMLEQSSQNYESSIKGGNDNYQRRIQRLEEELDEEREVNQKRVAETPQFLQMRKMMQSQNEKIRDLRSWPSPSSSSLDSPSPFVDVASIAMSQTTPKKRTTTMTISSESLPAPSLSLNNPSSWRIDLIVAESSPEPLHRTVSCFCDLYVTVIILRLRPFR